MVFDPLIANPGRLRILAALAAQDAQPFVHLRAVTGLTDGNLCTHARRLESAGLIAIRKTLEQGKPLTMLQLTNEGRAALVAHATSLLKALDRPASESNLQASPQEDDSDWVD